MNFHEIKDRLNKFYMGAGYRVSFTKTQRIFEMPGISGTDLFEGSEVFVSGIPSLAMEDQLIPFFSVVGTVVRFKLLLFHDSLYNRGFAIVGYSESSVAERAVNVLNCVAFNGTFLMIEKVTNNRRLFVGGLPEHKTKDQIWNELIRKGFDGIVDVIMYRSYRNRLLNRGYVFVEFCSYLCAAQTRTLFKNMSMWGGKISVDWSEPIPTVDDHIMSNVTKLFMRNIDVTMSRNSFVRMIRAILKDVHIEKIYKFKDYAFIHFTSRHDAQRALQLCKDTFKDSVIDVCWATPQEFAPKKKTLSIQKQTIYKADPVFPQLQRNVLTSYRIKENQKDCNDDNAIYDALEVQITSLLSAILLE